jgi:hypothetical protein
MYVLSRDVKQRRARRQDKLITEPKEGAPEFLHTTLPHPIVHCDYHNKFSCSV